MLQCVNIWQSWCHYAVMAGHAQFCTATKSGAYGRPAIPDWVAIPVADERPAEPAPSTDLGPAIGEAVAEHPTPIDDPAAAIPAPVVIEDQAVVADEAPTPE